MMKKNLGSENINNHKRLGQKLIKIHIKWL